jgi:mannose-6-phosphate isomerase-like protein (cupin superfamily)
MDLGTRDYYVGPEESLWPKPPLPGHDVRLLVGFKQSLGAYSLIKYVSTRPNEMHVHAYDDESAYLLEGELSVQVGDVMYDLEPGGFVYMPRRVPHRFIPRNGRAVALSIQTPGGVMDALVEEMGEFLAEGRELSNEQYVEMQQKHGIHAPDGWFRYPGQPD